MTEIDYYLLGACNQHVRQHFAIRLAEKAFRKQLQVYLHLDDQSEAEKLDVLMWNYRRNSFLPHHIEGTADKSPVVIGFNDEAPEQHQLMINLSSKRPGFFSSFDRVIELVIDQEPIKSVSRENYKFFKDRGYKLAVHQCQDQAETLAHSLAQRADNSEPFTS